MIAAAGAIVGMLFTLKIAWNIAMPYLLAKQALRSGSGDPVGTSMMPMVEIALLAILLALSALANGPTRMVAGYGVGAIAGSYIHLVIAGTAAGWIVGRIKRRGS
jgi:hypothetical protein